MKKRRFECMEPIDNTVIKEDVQLKSDNLLKKRYYIGKVFSKSLDFTVYTAFDKELGKKVFVREFTGKELAKLSQKYSEEELRERFLKYSRSMATINMCDILPHTIDVFVENQRCYLVTDYFDGENIKTLIGSGINISASNALKIVKKLLNGLKYIHSSGVIYGTICPETLYVLKNGEIRILGIAVGFYSFLKDIEERIIFLNPSYAAPENFKETQRLGAYTDVYSAAAILYRLLTNKIPAISFLRSGGENLIPPRKANKNIPKNVETALLNALNWQAENRTLTPSKFLNELSLKSVKRKLSGGIIWANVLGFLQSIYDFFIEKIQKHSKG